MLEEPIERSLYNSPCKEAYKAPEFNILPEQHPPLNEKLRELGLCKAEPLALPPKSNKDTSAELLDLCKRAY